MLDWKARISIDQRICHGQPCIKGTRVMVSVILDNLAAKPDPQAVIKSYPGVTLEDVQAAVAYAADLARERIVPLPGAA